MLLRLLLITAALAGFFFLSRWWRRSKRSAHVSYVAVAIGIATLLLLLAIRGGAEIVVPLAALFIPFLAGWLNTAWLKLGSSSESGSSNSKGSSGNIDRVEAYQILGLQPDASDEEIQAAYRRLMQRVHPDQGGSAYLAVRLNQARKVLLDR